MWVEAEAVDQDPAQRGRLHVALEIRDECQMLLIAQQYVRPWAVERVGMGVEQARTCHWQQVATRRVPGVGGVDWADHAGDLGWAAHDTGERANQVALTCVSSGTTWIQT